VFVVDPITLQSQRKRNKKLFRFSSSNLKSTKQIDVEGDGKYTRRQNISLNDIVMRKIDKPGLN